MYLYLSNSSTRLSNGKATVNINHYAVTKFLEQYVFLNRVYGTNAIYISSLKSSVYPFECSTQYNYSQQTQKSISSGYRGEISPQYFLGFGPMAGIMLSPGKGDRQRRHKCKRAQYKGNKSASQPCTQHKQS